MENGKITKGQLQQWQQLLEKYKAGKSRLERRIIEAEQAWKLRHWEQLRTARTGDPEPASGWLVNVILSKHSDACERYPVPVCLPREQGDEAEAHMLTAVLPVILQQNRFEKVWSDVWWYKLKGGTGVYGVFWDPEKNGGLGDIAIRKVDILNLFWEPGVTDIQDSRYVFHADLESNEKLEERYPVLRGKLKGGGKALSRYVYEDHIDTAGKSLVVDVYYRRRLKDGRTVLHFAKYCGTELLYATENDPDAAERGLYDHGKYPFVFDALFPEEGYPNCGFGYVDLCRGPQNYIDLVDNAMLKNLLVNVTPRWFIRSDGGVNEEEYADLTKAFVHVSGRLTEDSVRPVEPTPMPGIYLTMKQQKIDELKEVSGNRDVNNGGMSAGVTAASAITALQEAGNGISRDMTAAGYRAFAQVIELCIELIRQFYDVPRRFRILGENGKTEYIRYSNAGLVPRSQGELFGVDMGCRLPVFDIEVEIQRQNEYTAAMNNELALQLYQLGVLNPAMAEQSLLLLELMDFRGKDRLKQQLTARLAALAAAEGAGAP